MLNNPFTEPSRSKLQWFLLIFGISILVGSSLVFIYDVQAQDISPLHPTFPLLDVDGNHVLESNQPVSTIKTCGGCHDTEFISEHSFHADVGLNALSDPGEQPWGQSWDISPGLFGKWNPLTYQYLSPEGDDTIDLTTPAWIQRFGSRHVGGGPAESSRDGLSLLGLTPSVDNVETSILEPETGELNQWSWEESGVVEMNCFLCHWPDPSNEERIAELQSGNFGWANSATLLGSAIIEKNGTDLQWNPDVFDENGDLHAEFMKIKDPGDENCGLCHGLVSVDPQTPVVMTGCSADQWSTITTGQLISPQKINQSGVNLEGKSEINRSWDIHSERVVECTDCHYSINNPVYYQESNVSRPDHLEFDPRRIDLGEYLYRPLHQFAKGNSATGTLAPEFNNSLRRCESCHNASTVHDWLPYTEKHLSTLSCESCHVPELFAPARQTMDWTVLKADGTPWTACRGVETNNLSEEATTFANTLINGYEPVLLPRESADGNMRLSPHNLVSSWFWIYDDPPRPVPYASLAAVWMDGDGNYHDDIIAKFDQDGNGIIDENELHLDDPAKENFIAGKLEDQGLKNPRIEAEIRPYNINHNVTHGEWAVKDCDTCHTEDSRLTQAFLLSDRTPGNVTPTYVNNGTTSFNGFIETADDGAIYYQPYMPADNLYVLGHNNVQPVDIFGSVLFVGTLLGVFVHGGLRVLAARRDKPQQGEVQEVYMYTVYERLWHWLQTAVILILLFTGLIIHKPDIFGIFSFRFMVEVHNIMAFILIANAALALFYNLVSGEIKQYLPQPRGFFNQAFQQTKFYLQGIFKGAEHPFEKTPERKLNPLQQVTYFGLLNVLLPLQIITGILMWGAQIWPETAARIGGLPFLAPFHTLISWLLASFIVMHVYLTTTGTTPTTAIKAMIMGWDELEVHHAESTASPERATTD